MNTLETRSSKALSDYRAGRFADAIALQIEIVNEVVGDDATWIDAAKHLCLFLFSSNQHEACIPLLERILTLNPRDFESMENLGVILSRTGRYKEAIVHLDKATRGGDPRPNLYDALAHAYAKVGNTIKAVRYGEKSLILKNEESGANAPVFPLTHRAINPFDPTNPERNLISFSLWGEGRRYTDGALRNARLAPDIYPGWTCRFYCDDSVPSDVLQELKDLGGDVVMKERPETFYEGLFWRFEVMSESGVDRFIVRDCDSVINVRERVAVDEWLGSNRHFHVMRDYYSHTELILAGMWGGIGTIFPPFQEIFEQFAPATGPTATYDQLFLREMVWPTVKQSVLTHDRYFRCLGAKPFPTVGTLPPDRHVGQNEFVLQSRESHREVDSEELVIMPA